MAPSEWESTGEYNPHSRIEFPKTWGIGVRFDRFNADVTNNGTAPDFNSDDGLLSPRLGLIYKPVQPLSLYGSYTLTCLPRAGEQLASLSLTNQALEPEEFRNYASP